jgi:hypothetical protein
MDTLTFNHILWHIAKIFSSKSEKYEFYENEFDGEKISAEKDVCIDDEFKNYWVYCEIDFIRVMNHSSYRYTDISIKNLLLFEKSDKEAVPQLLPYSDIEIEKRLKEILNNNFNN